MTITTNTTDRKALAKAIAEELGTTARYLGLPSYGYQIGDFTVDHDGNIIGEDFGALQDFLRRNGYVNNEPAADQEAVTEALPDEEAPADSEAEPITQMDISIPARNAAVAQLKNLIFMLHSRQTLINRMTDSECLNIPDILIDRLQESTLETSEALTDLLDDCKTMVPMFITTLSQTRMKSRFLAADEYISPKKSNRVGASWLKPSRKIAHLRLSSPPYIMEAQRRQAR